MKIINKDYKKGIVKLKIENQDDIWYLSTILDTEDRVEGKTFRKVKLGSETDRNAKIVKKPIYITIQAEKVEFAKTSPILRISGKTEIGTDDIPKGSYHTFNIEETTIITIQKQKWLQYQKEKLEEAAKATTAKILLCLLDREEAIFAIIKKYGYEILSHIKGTVQKKDDNEKGKADFYPGIVKQLKAYQERYKISQMIIASPAFWKEELLKEIKDDALKKIIIQATCSSVDANGINELLKRPEVNQALQQERITKEMKVVEQLLAEIAKQALAVYGLKATEEATQAGAVKTLLLTDHFIQKTRQANTFQKIDTIMKTADAAKATIHIISADHDGGKKLEGLGGIAAILRYQLNY